MKKKNRTIQFLLFCSLASVVLLILTAVANSKEHGASASTDKQTAIITILDMNGDGIKTTDVKNGAYFDHDANGFAEQTGWSSADDGILVWDRNNNGLIDNGKEVFSDYMSLNGKSAKGGLLLLKEFDKNGDGKITAKDSIFSKLKVWQDRDGDGYSSSDELFSLEDKGIRAILLDYKDSNITDPNGNKILRTSNYEKNDGAIGRICDCMVLRDTAYTISNKWLDVPAGIASLPNLQGYGNVHDLHQAMARDKNGKLTKLVRMAVAETNPETRTVIFEQILFRWVGADTVDLSSRGGNIDARKLTVLEKFFGQGFVDNRSSKNPHESSVANLNEAYIGMFEMFHAQFLARTHLKELYGLISYSWDESKQTIKGDLAPVIKKLQSLIVKNQEQGKEILREFARTIKGFRADDSGLLGFNSFLEAFSGYGKALHCIGPVKQLTGGNRVNYLYSSIYPTIIKGNALKDHMFGWICNDELYGGGGADNLYGSAGNDLLDGGTEDDYLYGGPGDDTYIFGRGYGWDAIYEFDNSMNIVRFTKGVFPADLEFVLNKDYVVDKSSNTLTIYINNTDDHLLIQEWQKKNHFTVMEFVFADGTVLRPSDVMKVVKSSRTISIRERALRYLDDKRKHLLLSGIGLLIGALLFKAIKQRKNKNEK